MPRKTKETNDIIKPSKLNSSKEDSKKATTKKTTAKSSKSTSKKNNTTKTLVTETKKVNSKKSPTKTTTKTKSTKSTTKSSTKKSATTKKTTSKKSATKKNTKSNKTSNVDIVEYYDLPYRYNQTVVKVLAQTPTTLFIYWDISDRDREKYKELYGEDFFETTKPVLKIHNTTMNYSFEIDINDFANSWYLHVNDAKCDYKIELGRRPIKESPKINTDYIYISTSNEIESPNDHILFNKEQKMVYFKNIKTGVQTSKPISTNISFIRNMGKIYNIYDIYKAIYKNENVEEIYDLSNPSSNNPSSGSLSSNFKHHK